jgi:hypothetical protein
MFHHLLKTVKLFLCGAISLIFLRALFFPNVLDIFVLFLLFLVLMAMFIGS